MSWGRGQQPQQPYGQQGHSPQEWQQAGPSAPQAPAAAPRLVWEYKVLEPPAAVLLEQTLNTLGAQGWELVEIDATPVGKIAKGQLYVFKRPRA